MQVKKTKLKESPPNVSLLSKTKSLKQNNFIFDEKSLENLHIAKLQKLARDHGVSTSGKRVNIIARLKKELLEEEPPLNEDDWMQASKLILRLCKNKKYKAFFFTWNADISNWAEKIFQENPTEYVIQQKSKNSHIQGLLFLKNARRPEALQAKLPGIHLEKPESMKYCNTLNEITYIKGCEKHFKPCRGRISLFKHQEETKAILDISGLTIHECKLAFSSCSCGSKCEGSVYGDRYCDKYDHLRLKYCIAFYEYKHITFVY